MPDRRAAQRHLGPASAADAGAGLDDRGDDTTARLAAHIGARAAAAHPGRSVDALLADDLAGNELTTLLLHALRRRARRRSFADVLAHGARMPMSHASAVDGRRLHAIDGALFAAATGFDVVELAPALPLGTSACAGVDPNHVLTTSRLAEIAADPTSGLALLAARRRKAGVAGPVHLCASQRVLRLQPLDNPEFSPHFRLAGLLTAERAERSSDDDHVERRVLAEHLAVWATTCAALAGAGFDIAGVRVVVSDTRVVRAALATRGLDADVLSRRAVSHRPGSTERILAEVGADLPRAAADGVAVATELGLPAATTAIVGGLVDDVARPLRERPLPIEVGVDFARLQGLGYYRGPFVQIHVRRTDGLELAMGDGGALPWLEAMLSDRRQRLVSTGLGIELLVKLFSRR